MQKNQPRPRKLVKKKEDSIEINMQKVKNRYSIYNAGSRNSQQGDFFKSMNRKSIQVNNTQPVRALNTISQLSRPVYRRISQAPKIAQTKRYQQQSSTQLKNRASPYLKQPLSRTSILNRSSTKIKSGSLTKQVSPYQLYKQPRSSLSQHYDPTLETSLHKIRYGQKDQKNQVLRKAKDYYKDSQFDKCKDYLKKYLRNNSQTNSVELQYLLGMCLINSDDLQQGAKALNKAVQLNPYYKKTLYLILALAYKRLGNYDQAIDILTKALQIYPDYYDCIVYRGKMYLKAEMYESARKDFSTAIQLSHNKGFAYLGKGTCEIHMKLTQEAIKTFTAGTLTDLAHVCYQKRGICYYQEEKYELALDDFQQSSTYQKYLSSSLNYYKGMIYYLKKNYTQSLLSFEQSLKCDNNREIVTLAIEMMLKIKIQDKDFYQAYHLISRTDNIQIDKQVIQEWKMFLQASLFLMKKKYKEGLDTYQLLQRKQLYQKNYQKISTPSQRQRFKFLKPLIHLYKAFGYLSQNKAQKALLQYQYHSSICISMGISDQNLSKHYNSLIVLCTKNFPHNISSSLLQAQKLIPIKPQPYLFISFDILHKLQEQNSQLDKQVGLNQIIENLSIGIGHLPQLSNNHISSFYYFRAVINLYSNQFNRAVQDVDKAIEKSQDNIPKYFYLRGLIFACFGNFTQAIQDLSVAINLDDKFAKPFLQRAKCLQIQGNSNQAFIDLQKYITLAPDDPYIHKYAGFLLFQNCAYQDCLSAFGHGSDLPNDYQLLLTKAKCNFLLGNYYQALQYFQSYGNMFTSNQFQVDIQIIRICKELNNKVQSQKLNIFLQTLQKIIQQKIVDSEQNKIFKLRDIHQLKGSILLFQQKYQQAMFQFNQTLSLFRTQKQKQYQKNLIEDPTQFQDEWSEIQIKFNISLCHLCLKNYQLAFQLLCQYSESTQKGKNWDTYINLIEDLISEKIPQVKQLDTFEQNHRISKLWPKIQLPDMKISLSMAFSYPFVQPPQMMSQFDTQLLLDFDMKKVQPKPQAPWIHRNQTGLVFTPNIQIYDNLELSMTTKKNQSENQQNKPMSDIDQSISLSNSEFQMETEDLKKKFKLDSDVEMRLNKILKK